MPRWLGIVAMFAALLAGASFAHGQKQTERYIPLGQSPGLSGKATDIGVIEAADSAARTITVAGSGARRTVRVTNQTRIWLDRSRMKLTTLDGSFADLQRGHRVEVMPGGAERDAPAVWIKVENIAADGSAR